MGKIYAYTNNPISGPQWIIDYYSLVFPVSSPWPMYPDDSNDPQNRCFVEVPRLVPSMYEIDKISELINS